MKDLEQLTETHPERLTAAEWRERDPLRKLATLRGVQAVELMPHVWMGKLRADIRVRMDDETEREFYDSSLTFEGAIAAALKELTR